MSITHGIGLNPTHLHAGDVIHVRGTKLWPSRAIRRALGGKVWGNHDALAIPYNNRMRIGETAPMFSRLIEVGDYNAEIEAGTIRARVFRMPGLTEEMKARACEWWIDNVQGRPYDFAAYPRLLVKCIVGDLFAGEAGWRWANWCTEGVAKALSAGVQGDVYGTRNPTPLHTEKLVKAGVFIEVTDSVLYPVHNSEPEA
jgi:hypothetical protein